jgi:GNAT superfamily N-acetyltransferase
MTRTHRYEVPADACFFFVSSTLSGIHRLPLMRRDRGPPGAIKLCAKIALKRCIYFGLAQDGQPLSTGIASLGYCRFYHVPRNAVVFGEIVTREESRGRGFATRAIMLAINRMIGNGSTLFYIDTQLKNAPMIRSIEKLGFGIARTGSTTWSNP